MKVTEEINRKFQSLIEPLFAKYRKETEEIAGLVGIRYMLLPKLLSSEITLNSDATAEAITA